MAGVKPVAIKDRLFFLLENILVEIVARRNGKGLFWIAIEGLVIGALSWSLGALLSLPVSAFLSDQVGLALLKVPLNYQYSIAAATLWFFALMLIAVAASLGPAKNAVRLTIREVLSYE